MVGLTKQDNKFWRPLSDVVRWLANRLPDDARVLEIGPGQLPFWRAGMFVDNVNAADIPADRFIKCDVNFEPLPFADKSFDFVYCRHVLEDMVNPFMICSEMSRVAKAGYIETPSPFAELCRGIDGDAPPWRGYHHHRWIVWVGAGELRFVTKFPVVEYMDTANDTQIVSLLRSGPWYWNSYYLWEGQISQQRPLEFNMPGDYGSVLTGALHQSKAATDMFWQKIPHELPRFATGNG